LTKGKSNLQGLLRISWLMRISSAVTLQFRLNNKMADLKI
jgi:hypothetical protein